MSKKTLALIAGLTVLTLVLVILALNIGQQVPGPQDSETAVSEEPTPTIPAHTLINLSPNPVTLTAGTATVEVMIDTSDNMVTGTQFDLVYDPKVFNFGGIKQGTFFTSALILINDVDRTNGKVTYALGLTPAQIKNPKSGSGTVATITLTRRSTAPTTGSSELKLENVLVSAKGIGPSVLKQAKGTTVNLSASSASTSGR